MVKVKNDKSTLASAGVQRERICILMGNFVHSMSIGPHTNEKTYQRWQRGQIITKESEIKLLKDINAPIEVFYRDVNRTTES